MAKTNLLHRGLALHKAGDLTGAAATYRQLLRTSPKEPNALRLLGVIEFQGGRLVQAERLLAKAAAANPASADAHYFLGRVSIEKKDVADAERHLGRAVELDGRHVDALTCLGTLALRSSRFETALAFFRRALTVDPTATSAAVGEGHCLVELGLPLEAVGVFDRVLARNLMNIDAWYGRGNALRIMRRRDQALACYEKVISLDATFVKAWVGRAYVLFEQLDLKEAETAFREATQRAPDTTEAWLGLAQSLEALRRYDEAIEAFDRALAVRSTNAEEGGHTNASGAPEPRHDFGRESHPPDKRPDLVHAQYSLRLSTRMHACDWSGLQSDWTKVRAGLEAGVPASAPLLLLPLAAPVDVRRWTERYACKFASPTPLPGRATPRHDKIRLAYVSADFRMHPIAWLLTRTLELHDRSRFDVTAIDLHPDHEDPLRDRIKAAVDRFVIVARQGDEEVAALMHDLEVDVAIDLMGHTFGARPGILAKRPAPIQVNYLGYPGTMGAPFIDYIIADTIVIPPEMRAHYSESVVYLPDTFQPNDSDRSISSTTPTRAAAGLPKEGFVFCCFNNSFKIGPDIFDVWMRVLDAVGGSVLWLNVSDEKARQNLVGEAQRRGIAGDRLVFASRVERNEDHLARLRLAGLFLDTIHYNAHTTASDALWAGVPVVTCLGVSYAGRVAGSLLHAVGLPELITTSLPEYEALAIELARNAERLASLRKKLAENRATCALFDTARFTRHLEAAYRMMWERYQDGKMPAHFDVPRLEDAAI